MSNTKQLEIAGISNPVNSSKPEYIKINVLININNLSNFALFDETYADGSISGIHKHFYIFPAYQLKVGDTIFVKNGEGKNTPMPNPAIAGNTVYTFYTQSGNDWINNTGDNISLIIWNKVDGKKLNAVV